MPGHGVDGKIAAAEIFCQFAGKRDAFWVAVIKVFTVNAEGRDFVGAILGKDGEGAMLDACRDDALVFKKRHHFFCTRGGADVPVAGAFSHQRIAHAAANDIGFVAMLLQTRDDLARASWNMDLHPFTSFLNGPREILLS